MRLTVVIGSICRMEATLKVIKEYWIEACEKQLAKIEKKGTWKICDLPKGHKVIPTKWVFDPKVRARLVVCGNFETDEVLVNNDTCRGFCSRARFWVEFHDSELIPVRIPIGRHTHIVIG
jgi:hypothetical protein